MEDFAFPARLVAVSYDNNGWGAQNGLPQLVRSSKRAFQGTPSDLAIGGRFCVHARAACRRLDGDSIEYASHSVDHSLCFARGTPPIPLCRKLT